MSRPEHDPTDSRPRPIEYLLGTVSNVHLWLIVGVLAATTWHAYTSPTIAISAGVIEGLLAATTLVALAGAVRGTRKSVSRARH